MRVAFVRNLSWVFGVAALNQDRGTIFDFKQVRNRHCPALIIIWYRQTKQNQSSGLHYIVENANASDGFIDCG